MLSKTEATGIFFMKHHKATTVVLASFTVPKINFYGHKYL